MSNGDSASSGTRLAAWLRQRWPEVGLAALCLAAVVARFVGLEKSPPGAFMDEALAGLHFACLGQTGESGYGVSWPLFAKGFAGGFYTPVYLYLGVAWTKLLGVTIASIRAYSAFATVVTLVGVYFLGKRIAGPRFALYALLIGCLSPWSFQFSRIAWDPPFAPPFLVWGCYFWLHRRPLLGAALAGVMFAGALYTYPPFRIQAPLLFVALFFLAGGHVLRDWKRLACFAGTLVPLAIPLLRFLSNPQFMGRSLDLAIFSRGYLESQHGHLPNAIAFLRILGDNISLYFRPSFLFFTGDPNGRHSIQMFGMLGLLEDLALVLGGVLILATLRGRPRPAVEYRPPLSLARVVGLGLAGVLAGVLAGALTHEGLPHALRSIGVWPFYALLGATVFTVAERRFSWLRHAVLATACVHMALYGWLYFQVYPRFAGPDFWADRNQQMLDWDAQSDATKSDLARNEPEQLRFLRIHAAGLTCEQSEQERLRYAK